MNDGKQSTTRDEPPIRLTTTSYALLALLDQLGESTSYDIKQALDKSIENFWPVPHTTAYEEPARLDAGGYLSVTQEDGGRRRKSYSLTEAGRAALAAWAAEPIAAPPQLRDELMLKVFAGADPSALTGPGSSGIAPSSRSSAATSTTSARPRAGSAPSAR